MKKIVIAIAAVLLVSAAVFADGFQVKGFLRAGYSTEFDGSDPGSTATWLGGDYFGGSSRSCINFCFDNKDNTAGAFLMLRWDGDMSKWSTTNGYPQTKFAYGYVSVLDKKVTVAAGLLKDKWVNSSGWEGYSVFKGAPGAVIVVSPVKGLNVAGGLGGRFCNYTVDSKLQALFGGVKYTSAMFSAAANGSGAGVVYGNLNVNAIKNLSISTEYQYASKDAMKAVTSDSTVKASMYPYMSVLDEQLEYTGIDNLTLGLLSYQFLHSYSGPSGAIVENSNWKITITPAVEYDFSSMIGVTLEGTYTLYSDTFSKSNFLTITPAVKLSADKLGIFHIWGTISSDAAQADSCAGIGVIKKF